MSPFYGQHSDAKVFPEQFDRGGDLVSSRIAWRQRRIMDAVQLVLKTKEFSASKRDESFSVLPDAYFAHRQPQQPAHPVLKRVPSPNEQYVNVITAPAEPTPGDARVLQFPTQRVERAPIVTDPRGVNAEVTRGDNVVPLQRPENAQNNPAGDDSSAARVAAAQENLASVWEEPAA